MIMDFEIGMLVEIQIDEMIYNKYLFKYDAINILVTKLVLTSSSAGEMSSEGPNINCLSMDQVFSSSGNLVKTVQCKTDYCTYSVHRLYLQCTYSVNTI